jgi:AcrR family transcriptional regulator
MRSQERRQRHRARIRETILAAARELLVAAGGARRVSLRRIADRVEYSPAALYTYFRCKDDIFRALVEEDSADLHRRVDEATRQVVDPLSRIRAALWALHEFLDAHPLFLELMIVDDSTGSMKPLRRQIEADVDRCIERGQLSMALTAAATRQLLCLGMLGAAAVAPRLACDEACDGLAHNLLETLLAGLSTSPCRRRAAGPESTFPEATG